MRRKPALLTIGLAFGLNTLLYAHGDHQHVMGRVIKVEATRLQIRTTEGKTVSLRLTDQTKYFRGQTIVRSDAVETGSRVVVDASRDGDRLIAQEVRIGTGDKPAGNKGP